MNELDMGDNVAWTDSTGGAQLRWRWGSRSPSVDASATFRWPYGLWVLQLRAVDLRWTDGAPLTAEERRALRRAIERRGAPTDWAWIDDAERD
jgi:hypothetical protein